MELAGVSGRMRRAVDQMSNASEIDDQVVNRCLEEIASALLDSDVASDLVLKMQDNIKSVVFDDNFNGREHQDKLKSIRKAIFCEVRDMLDPGAPTRFHTPVIGYPSIVMFVGLQGSGKTRVCAQYARHYIKKRRAQVAVVLADSMQGSDRDHLICYALEAKIPIYGINDMESGIAFIDGVKEVKPGFPDIVVVDTSDCHMQQATLFQEMLQLHDEIQPKFVIYVLDSSIGRSAALDQVQAFSQSFPVGAIILTKTDANASILGVLSAVAMSKTKTKTKMPVLFLETGKHSDELEDFKITPFVTVLLGMDEFYVPPPPLKLTAMCAQGLKRGQERYVWIKKILDSMTNEELDAMDTCNFSFLDSSRVIRIAETSGLQVSQAKGILDCCIKEAKTLKIIRDAASNNVNQVIMRHGA